MIIRVRSNVGVWRVEDLDAETANGEAILAEIAKTRPHVSYEMPLSLDPACKEPLDLTASLRSQNLGHGSMVHCRVDPSSCATTTTGETTGAEGTAAETSANTKRIIDKDGRIKLVPSTEVGGDKGFRRGMMPLRDIKMAWTLNEFVAMDEQFVFKMKRQDKAVCSRVSVDVPSIQNFQSYLQRFQFARKRFAFLYGRYEEPSSDNNDSSSPSVVVEAIYEPPQEPDADAAEGFEQLEDPLEEKVEEIAKLLGLQKVGWIFGHPPRDDGIVLTTAEVIMAAELQLEAAGGVEETSFVTIKVGQAKDGTVGVEAFQVSQQCMAMVAEEALEIGTDPGVCVVHETFTAIQEGKESKTIDNNFFLTVVPIVQHTSEVFVSQFPRINRDLDDRAPSKDEMKRQLSKSGTAGWTFVDLVSDFNLLIYMTEFLDIRADFPKICQSVKDREVPLDDGYKIIIASMAGLDGAY